MVGAGRTALAARGSEDRCPGALHAVAADDGALVRLRVPGGYLARPALAALAEIAERYGDGALDITARANVQLRGLRESELEAVAAALARAELLPTITHERVRNIVANPFAGFDPAEMFDVRPFVEALDRALAADASLRALPPKFLFAIDGGGRGVDSRGADLIARVTAGTPPRFAIAIAGERRTLEVPGDELVATLLALARHACGLAARAGLTNEAWRLRSLPNDVDRIAPGLAYAVVSAHAVGSAHAVASKNFEDVANVRSGKSENANTGDGDFDLRSAYVVTGSHDAADRASLILVPSIPLGRISAAQARIVTEIATTYAAELRLGSWRGLALCGVPRNAAAHVSAVLAEAGLPLDARDGFAGIAACAGRGACDAALADVRADAAQLAATFAEHPVSSAEHTASSAEHTAASTDAHAAPTPWSVNFAGCEKRCAMRHDVSAECIATADGYTVRVRGESAVVALDAPSALALLASARARAGATR